ncbi:MAG: CPBP family intramembrane metalloprotease [Deltaproteobacteria bacterium]|nr:CPBP family intramembrane metalloprotease [Deltaproteobacteria bacterium]
MTSRKKEILEAALLFVVALVLLKLLYLNRGIPWISRLLPLLSAMTLVYLPLGYLWYRKSPVDFLYNAEDEWRRAITLFFITSLAVFPVFVVAAHFYDTLFMKMSFHEASFPQPLTFGLFQVFLVALPEEFFFRGWLQSFLNRHFEKKWRILGTAVGPAWFLTALIFATSHSFITVQWWHFAIFFPALLFGWLRERSGSILASTLFHAASNIVTHWIDIHYR